MIVEYMTIDEACDYLGVSKVKMAKLLKDGILKTIPDRLNLRVKLVKKEDVDKLKICTSK
jgi:excisionase family DNA binding protein